MMPFYIYFHIRPDTGDVFYVGRGKHYKRSSFLRRAYEVKRRNHIWKGIVERNGWQFEVHIFCHCLTLEESQHQEQQAIASFGKIIDGTGPLCNLTDGGDGVFGLKHSEEARRKMREKHAADPSRKELFRSEEFKAARRIALVKNKVPSSMKGRKHSKETKALYSEIRRGSKHYAAKKVINLETGIVYGCVEDAAVAVGMGKWSLYKSLSGERQNHTPMQYV